MKAFAIAAGLLVTSGAAGAETVFSPRQTEACLAGGASADDCVGTSAATCMDTTEGGQTTVGMSNCFNAEYVYWDGRLNSAYQAVMAKHRADDAELAELGGSSPSLADALRNMQRAWIPWRDAACGYERDLWGNGTGSGPAQLACLMEMTADRALALEARLLWLEEGAP